MVVDAFLERSAQRDPQKIALICGDRRVSYGELAAGANRLARSLRDGGLRRGDRLAVYCDNSVEAVIALFGAFQAGAVVIPINASTKPRKLVRLLRHARARALVTHARLWLAAREVWDDLTDVDQALLIASDQFPVDLSSSRLRAFEGAATAGPSPDGPLETNHIDMDLALLIYTSGSTGDPKGVMLTHRNLATVCRSVTQYLNNTADDVILSVLPLSFGYGMNQVLTAFLVGATVALEKNFMYPQETLERMVSEGATGIPMVPTVVSRFLQQDLRRYDTSRLRYITNAGAALPPQFAAELRLQAPHVQVFAMYGQTECTRISYLEPDQLDRRPTSVGRGIPNQEHCIVDDQGRPVAPDEVGELVVRGSHVMAGYWDLPAETARKLRPFPASDGAPPETASIRDGALYTGDLFRADAEGYLYFVSRMDDIIKTRGEKVSPREVEDALYGIAGVAEAAVVGEADPDLGQVVKAVVAPKPGTTLRERDILKACAGLLEDYMVPRIVEIRDALPRTSSGKIDKQELRTPSAPVGG